MTGHQAGSGRTRHIARNGRRFERGATLVEMAIVLPILLLIIISIAEIGLYFRSYLTASHASREGARVGAFVGDVADADCLILESIGSILSGTDLSRVERIEIYKAAQNGTQTDTNIATLKNGGDPSICNEPSQPADGWFRTTAWPATSRNTTVGTNPLDIIGVRVVMEHQWATGFPPWTGSTEVDDATITRLEPEAFEE